MYVFKSIPRAKVRSLNTDFGLGVTELVNCVAISLGMKGVLVCVGVSDTDGVFVIVGVRVMVGVSVMVGDSVIVGIRLGVGDGS